jgi:hypothetical protein
MKTYRLVTIGEEVSLTLQWAEAKSSNAAIQKLTEWAEANGWKPALKEQDLTNPEYNCAIQRFDEFSED